MDTLLGMGKRPTAAPPPLAHKRRRHFIQQWRESRGFSQAFVGEHIGVEGATISRIESGEIGYIQDRLEAMADLFGVHPNVLISRPPRPDEWTVAPPRPKKSRA